MGRNSAPLWSLHWGSSPPNPPTAPGHLGGILVEITAKQINEWAGTKGAQATLPRYIRRLIHEAGSITQIAVPAGDSTSQPGWDGELISEQGNAWVPQGLDLRSRKSRRIARVQL